MYNILLNTPFGFIFELSGARPYERDVSYELFLDGRFLFSDTKNVLCIFGLAPNRNYLVEVRDSDGTLRFEHKTEEADYVFDIRNYGAVGDGVHDDTSAINAAIYTAVPGSIVRIPAGEYMVSSVLLKSGIDIYLEDGAQIRQIPDEECLPIIKGYQKNFYHTRAVVNASWEGNPLDSYGSLIYGCDVENIRIYGSGIIDGSGEQGDFWKAPKEKKAAWRPRNLFLSYCNNIIIAGITSQNSAAWNLHPFYCNRVKFYGLNIKSAVISPNTDGINPESCGDVEIVGCNFDVGDDCIAIKSGKFFMSRRHYKPSTNIIIRNCLMENGHGAVVLGSEISCGVSDVRVTQCLFRGTDRGLRVKTRRGRGDTSVVSGIHFENVVMDGVDNCFTINMFYNCDPDGKSDYVGSKEPLPVGSDTPTVMDIVVDNVKADGISGCALFFYGLPESPIRGVKVTNSTFSFLPEREVKCPEMMTDEVLIPNLGVFMENVEDVVVEDVDFEGEFIRVERGERREESL